MPPTEKTLDSRSLCGINNCTERATSLYAWPLRLPVPLCAGHKDVIEFQVATANLNPRQWLDWAKLNLKAHLNPPKREG